MREMVFMIAFAGLLSVSAFGWQASRPADSASASPANANPISEADRLFAHGEDAARDRQALAVLERALALDANNYQLLWRLARSCYFVGDDTPKNEKARYFERGIEMARRAVMLEPNGVEGHFWLGVNYGGISEQKGALNALQLVKKIRAEMETVVRLNGSYEDGGAYLALGEIDHQLPRLFGGNLKRAISYLEQGVRVAPQNMELKLALAETYLDAGRREDSRRQLQEILGMSINLARAKENRATQEKARKLLSK
jgi:hypothetical protein